MRKPWHHDTLGTGITRETGTNGLVTVRKDSDNGVNVTVRHAVPFGCSVVYMITHTRHFTFQTRG